MKLTDILSLSHYENFRDLFKIILSEFSEKEMLTTAAATTDEKDSKSSVISFKQVPSFIKLNFSFSLDLNVFVFCE